MAKAAASKTESKPASAKPGSAKPAAAKSVTGASLLTIKVTLQGVKPSIWRRMVVIDSTTLGGLHRAIQAVMGWHDCHLHVFVIDQEQYGDPRTTDDVADENRVRLSKLHKSGVTRFGYTYDFGDSWDHVIVIEKSQPASPDAVHPVCIAGKRRCPPEDCGGPWGYSELQAILADPAHPERDDRLEWLGDDDFDPETFDLDAANRFLRAYAKRA